MKCYTGNCSWGITSQRPELYRRIDPREGAVRLANLLRAWSHELKEILLEFTHADISKKASLVADFLCEAQAQPRRPFYGQA